MPYKPELQRIITDLGALKAYFDPIRLRLLTEMSDTPRSVQALSAITDIPFTRLYYHIHLLEKFGFIQVVDVQHGAGAIEVKFYQITALSFVVDRRFLQLGTPEGDAGFALVQETVFDETKRDIRHSIESGMIDQHTLPPHPRSLMARRGVFRLNDDDAREFYQRLIDLKEEFYNRDCNVEGAQYYNFTIVVYPTTLEASEDDTPPV
jgi:hypothetical protein